MSTTIIITPSNAARPKDLLGSGRPYFCAAVCISELEVDEGIASSLRDDDQGEQDAPGDPDKPKRQALDYFVQLAIAHAPVNNEHHSDSRNDLNYIDRIKNLLAIGVENQHGDNHAPSRLEVFGAKEYPSDIHKQVGEYREENLATQRAP